MKYEQRTLKNILQRLEGVHSIEALREEITSMFREVTSASGTLLIQFLPEGNAEVVAEKSHHFYKFVGLTFPKDFVRPLMLPPFYKGYSLAFADSQTIGSCQWLDDAYLVANNLTKDKNELLETWQLHFDEWKCFCQKLGFKSVLWIPFVQDNTLTGGLLAFYLQKHELPTTEVLFYEQFSYLVPVLFKNKSLEEKYFQEESKKKYLDEIIQSFSEEVSWKEAFTIAQRALLSIANATGLMFFDKQNSVFLGKCPSLERGVALKNWLLDSEADVWTTHQLAKHLPTFASLKKIVCGVFAIKLGRKNFPPEESPILIWIRPEKIKVTKWISKLPLLHEESFPIEEATFPHFVETEFGNAEKWTDSDIYFLKKIQGYLSQLYERKCQEEHEKNNIFKLLLQNSSDVVAIIEENFDIRFVSDSAWEVFGVSPQEVIERNVEMIHPDDLPLLADFLTRAKESTQKVEPFVYRVKHKTGDYIYLETVASNQLHNLFIRGLVVNSRDITERQKTKEKLLRFEKIVESLKDGVLILEDSSKNYAIMYANPAFYQITGLVEKDVLHQSGVFFLKKDAKIAQWKEIQDALAHEQETSFFLQSTHSSGRELLLNIQLYPIPDALENKKKFILIVQDITSQASIEKTLKEYAKKLRKSNEELETFAYIASHDLQEPLRTVIGFTELIAETYAPHFDKEGLEYVQFVLQASRRMKNLIQDLLRFSRVGTGKEYIEEVNMNEVFRTAYDNLYNAIEENHAVITSEILPTILANFTLLLQVMQNLLSNAIKYRKPSEHPIIHVGCEEHPDEWVFSVKDNGIGIPKKYHDRVFVIFQRLHTQEKFSGTGIGLAICKKVVEKYGGRIWLYSEEGKGSTFYFSVPKELKLL